jgi:hypothetical protein
VTRWVIPTGIMTPGGWGKEMDEVISSR